MRMSTFFRSSFCRPFAAERPRLALLLSIEELKTGLKLFLHSAPSPELHIQLQTLLRGRFTGQNGSRSQTSLSWANSSIPLRSSFTELF